MKINAPLLSLSALLFLTACKGRNNAGSTAEEKVTQQTTASNQPGALANQTKTYTAVISPDTAVLGKSREAVVKINSVSAVALQDPDGKDNGLELVFRLQLTNKTHIGEGSMIHVDYPDSRLQLDNGNNITCTSGTDFLRAEPEATSKEESWIYDVPAGARPKALNLFLDGTRVTVGVTLK